MTVSNSAATRTVANPTISNPARRKPGPVAASMIGLILRMTENATDNSTPLISADTGAGAWLWASASQV